MKNPTDSNFGIKLKKFRLINSLNQEEFAAKLSISRGTLINYEKGHTNASLDFISKIKDVFPSFDLDANEKIQIKRKIISDGYIDFYLLGKILLQGKKKIIFSTTLTIIASLLYLAITPNIYQAKMTMYPDNESQNNFGQIQNLVSSFNIPIQNVQDHGFSIPDIIKSRRIKDAILDTVWYSIEKRKKITLIDYWSINKNIFWKKKKNNTNQEKLNKEKGRLILGKRIGVNENRKSGLITISFNHEEPSLASSIAKFISASTQEFIQTSILKKANREKNFIMDRLALSKSEMVIAEETLKVFQSENRSIEKSPELQMVQNRLRRNVDSKQMVVNTLEQQLEISRIEAERTKPVLYILDQAESKINPIYPRKILSFLFATICGIFIGSFYHLIKK